MKASPRRPVALGACLLVLALCLGLWPQPTSAVRLKVPLADRNPSFGGGRFFRTGLTQDQPPATTGGVQLVTVQVQREWDSIERLPRHLSSHTSAVYRDRIFVVGGKTFDSASPPAVTKTGEFFATRIANLATGALRPWTEQPALPPLPVALSDAASIVVTVGSQPYLFVLGGQTMRGSTLDDVTTSRIFYYPINTDANGNLVVHPAWGEIGVTDQRQRLPQGTFLSENPAADNRGGGARGMGVATTTINGTPYIYVFGGLNRIDRRQAGGYTDKFLSEVWRASISGSGQNLTLSWSADPVSQIDGANAVPLEGAAAVTFQHPDTTIKDLGVYLIGGTRCISNCDDAPVREQEQAAYVAHIRTDGSITWLPKGSMSLPRSAHDAIQANGQILVLAGREDGQPSVRGGQGFVGAPVGTRQRTVADDLSLYYDPSAPTEPNFNLTTGYLGNAGARMNHSMETLSGSYYGQYVYMIGGQVLGSNNDIIQASNQVWVGNLNTPPEPNDTFVPDGKYYSKVYDFGPDAQYFNLYWTTIFKRDASNSIIPGQKIEMQYRTSNDGQTFSPWSTAVLSNDGQNSIALPSGTSARYLQFVATLYRSSTDLLGAPVLDKVELEVNRTGFPNLRFDSQAPLKIPSITLTTNIAPEVTITNQPFSETVPALDANWDDEGWFYVIMYKLAPGEAVPRAGWPTFGDPGIAFTAVNRASLPAGARFLIPPTEWHQWCATAPSCPKADNTYWHSQFTATGEYKVYLMVDANDTEAGWGDVKESDDLSQGEADNVSGPHTVNVLEAMKKLYAPFVARAGTTTSAAADVPTGRMPWPQPIK